MIERPILFSGPMIRAILEGRKTQTRRIVRGPGPDFHTAGVLTFVDAMHGRAQFGAAIPQDDPAPITLNCPYGGLGDELWVRETHALMCREADPYCSCEVPLPASGPLHYVEYRADTNDPRPGHWPADDPEAPRWRPSIHMPRWASRITLEVTDIRVQRLQDITEEDARAEGVDWSAPEPHGEKWDDDREDPREVGYSEGSFALDNFRRLWDQINAERAAWASNPWVWAVSFCVLKQEKSTCPST